MAVSTQATGGVNLARLEAALELETGVLDASTLDSTELDAVELAGVELLICATLELVGLVLSLFLLSLSLPQALSSPAQLMASAMPR